MEVTTVRDEQLDEYLFHGKFRYGSRIDTTDVVSEHGRHYPVFWLRYAVDRVQLSAKQRALTRKNSRFSFEFRRFTYTQELHELYVTYRDSITFIAADTLADCLGGADNSIFDSRLIEVRDNNKLIAAAVFDKGRNSIAGIINFYDPTYSAYSMGRYLMLLKMHYCKEHRIEWYYPGYFSPKCEDSKFNYKLFIDKNAVEVFIPAIEVWIPYLHFNKLIGG